MRKVIVNTTPIIALAGIGQLELLRKLYSEIWIPEAVNKEILSEPARTQVSMAEWIIVHTISGGIQKSAFSSRLHAGEIEVIILAQESDADLVIVDDNAAKKTAKYFGFPVTGTLGVLLKAKKQGLIDNVRSYIDKLMDNGLYIGPVVRNYVLEQADEM